MRTKQRFKRRIATFLVLIIVGLFSYTCGYSKGQSSVYEKAQNDIQFQKQVFGGDK